MTGDVIDLAAVRDDREATRLLRELVDATAALADNAADPVTARAIERATGGGFGMFDGVAVERVWCRARIAFIQANLLRHEIRKQTGIDVAKDYLP
ncbi:MAG: hypothetical protein F4092_08200 [Rhodospirillaceae bacterium]|nr:hypothetical protein [Rhodospirillales bacterium]MDE0717863.1 hypothetical protein [Rhodospirillaceae bacterium]MYF08176.1 hypothetical protein [Rhodospirillaceae bacterium]MYJ71734.1 hypothetical protein [Rhodospirillaceae bacterium]